jgi:hypothetical protein
LRLWSVLVCGGKGKEADFPFANIWTRHWPSRFASHRLGD